MSSTTATDIITYIGVPLAVLGVLPILYNTVATLAALSRIKSLLRHSRLTALTRSDVVNRVIEVELPRYAIAPWDRFVDRQQYWSLADSPSPIPGGSWTTLNWRTRVIGTRTQRLEYADQLRQPQCDVVFSDLICYLLDLGAVPDLHGWRVLRSTGLWAPVGCVLMKSPCGRHSVLTIAPPNDSDGHLSLALKWTAAWGLRDHSSLPPYWVGLQPFVGPSTELASPTTVATAEEVLLNIDQASIPDNCDGKKAHTHLPTTTTRVSCHISSNGVQDAVCETSLGDSRSIPSTIDTPNHLNVDHLRIQPGRTEGMWFASAITAYGTSSDTTLWNYKIPNEILAFARKNTVPCGVLVLLDMAEESETPEWASKHDDFNENLDRHTRRMREQRTAMDAESRLAPAQRAQAQVERMRKENQERLEESRDRLRIERQRKETRALEALKSPRWDTGVVARHALSWLSARGHISIATNPSSEPPTTPSSLTSSKAPAQARAIHTHVDHLLNQMVRDPQRAAAVCRMLDLWRAWADNGGMRREDLGALQDSCEDFAWATLLLAVIKDASIALEGSLCVDIQECLGMWHSVRLG